MHPLRLVSYNVRYFGHALRGLASTRQPKQRIAAGLAGLEPLADVICLQEVETISLRSRAAYRRKHNGETQLQSFMSSVEQAFDGACPYDAFYFPAHRYGPSTWPIYTTGLAILVHRERWQVEHHNQLEPHRVTHHGVEALRGGKQTRICAHVRLLPQGQNRAPIHVFNTHLSLPTPFAKEFWTGKQRMGFGHNQLREAHNLMKFVHARADGEPYVVCGDFNSPPSSPVYHYLTREAGLVGAQEALNLVDIAAPCDFATAGVAALRMHLDHLFGSRQVHWRSMAGTCRFGDKASAFHGCSDHVPLLGEFEVKASEKE